MSKIFQALLTGIFITFIFDFFIFLGLKINYIDFYKVDIYYNIFFIDNQNIFLYLLSSLFFGFVVIYLNASKTKTLLVIFFFLLSLSTLMPSLGKAFGERIFMQKNQVFKSKRYTFTGDIYYSGRSDITFYDYELQKTILLKKEELLP